jgi:hypothetical protein
MYTVVGSHPNHIPLGRYTVRQVTALGACKIEKDDFRHVIKPNNYDEVQISMNYDILVNRCSKKCRSVDQYHLSFISIAIRWCLVLSFIFILTHINCVSSYFSNPFLGECC